MKHTVIKTVYTTAPKDDPFHEGHLWDAGTMAQCLGEVSPLFETIEAALDDSELAGYGPEKLSKFRITIEEIHGEAK